jgi:hypothetical protein
VRAGPSFGRKEKKSASLFLFSTKKKSLVLFTKRHAQELLLEELLPFLVDKRHREQTRA